METLFSPNSSSQLVTSIVRDDGCAYPVSLLGELDWRCDAHRLGEHLGHAFPADPYLVMIACSRTILLSLENVMRAWGPMPDVKKKENPPNPDTLHLPGEASRRSGGRFRCLVSDSREGV